jgi:hypothetical protein
MAFDAAACFDVAPLPILDRGKAAALEVVKMLSKMAG